MDSMATAIVRMATFMVESRRLWLSLDVGLGVVVCVSVWGHQVAFYMIQEAHKRPGAGTGYHLGYCVIYFVIFSVE